MKEQAEKEIETESDLLESLGTMNHRLELIEQLLDMQMVNSMSPEEKEKVMSTFLRAKDLPGQNLVKRREKGLLEVFKFYSGQHNIKGRGMNFEEIEKEGSTLNQGEFFKFCTDFSIPLSKMVN